MWKSPDRGRVLRLVRYALPAGREVALISSDHLGLALEEIYDNGQQGLQTKRLVSQ
jgi:hypothetical protein